MAMTSFGLNDALAVKPIFYSSSGLT